MISDCAARGQETYALASRYLDTSLVGCAADPRVRQALYTRAGIVPLRRRGPRIPRPAELTAARRTRDSSRTDEFGIPHRRTGARWASFFAFLSCAPLPAKALAQLPLRNHMPACESFCVASPSRLSSTQSIAQRGQNRELAHLCSPLFWSTVEDTRAQINAMPAASCRSWCARSSRKRVRQAQ